MLFISHEPVADTCVDSQDRCRIVPAHSSSSTVEGELFAGKYLLLVACPTPLTSTVCVMIEKLFYALSVTVCAGDVYRHNATVNYAPPPVVCASQSWVTLQVMRHRS